MEVIQKVAIRQKDGTFSEPYPIGCKGRNIAMMSGINLEEELYLGSPNVTTFEEPDGILTITENFKKDLEDQTVEYYRRVTTFEGTEDGETTDTQIVQRLYFIDEEGNEILKRTKIVTFSGGEGSGQDDFSIKEEVI